MFLLPFDRQLLITTCLATLVIESMTLHVSNVKVHPKSDCKEVLTHSLKCRRVGTFAVAGECEYFVRCIQTGKGIEPEADFCSDGHIYSQNVGKCTSSHNTNNCPQKDCPIKPSKIEVTTPVGNTMDDPEIVMESTTFKPKPKLTTTKRFLFNLHPGKNSVSNCSVNIMLQTLTVVTLFIKNTLKSGYNV